MADHEHRLPVANLHRIAHEDALALVDLNLGSADEQLSGLLRYRFSSEWQADWKGEVGHWLETARRAGVLSRVVARCVSRQRGRTPQVDGVEANDARQLMLNSDLAPAMVLHYLDGSGWGFADWEPVCPPPTRGLISRRYSCSTSRVQIRPTTVRS